MTDWRQMVELERSQLFESSLYADLLSNSEDDL